MGWFSLVLGAMLLALAARTWRAPPAEDASPPKLLASVDAARPLRLFGVGVLVGGVNVKNLALYLSAVHVVARARIP